MEHQIQGLVLVDNEWVSRPLDVYRALARAQQTGTEHPENGSESATQAIEAGILSRTLFASPICTFVLCAKIRQNSFADVVLIGEESVQLKEVVNRGRLHHIATKTDFDGRIITAKTFGRSRTFTEALSVDNPPVKRMSQQSTAWTGDKEHNLPSEVIVLILTSRTMMFLWAKKTLSGPIIFSQKTIRLPAGTSPLNTFGTLLATDAKCRAIAVAAQEGRCILYKTRTMEAWQEAAIRGIETTPVEEELIISIDGRIMHMDFLASSSGTDDFHVVLLFIIAHQGRTKITCLDWDSRQDLSQVAVRIEHIPLDIGKQKKEEKKGMNPCRRANNSVDHNPSLLIPMVNSLDFLLVFDTHVSVYKDILSGVPTRNHINIRPSILPSLQPGDGRFNPRWTAWDRAPRNPQFSKEALYIAREDGRIIYLEQSSSNVTDVGEVGIWPTRIDTAFACINVDRPTFSQVYPDILIAGSAGNDSILGRLESCLNEDSDGSQHSEMNQSFLGEWIPNWAPLTDLCIRQASNSRLSCEDKCASIFVTGGISPYGAIFALRYGLRARVDDFFMGVDGCTGLWIVGFQSQLLEHKGCNSRRHSVTIIIGFPTESLVVTIHRTQPDFQGDNSVAWHEGEWEKTQMPPGDEDDFHHINQYEATLAACLWSEDFILQVTQKQACLLHSTTYVQSDSILFHDSLLMAVCSPEFPLMAVAYHEHGITYVSPIFIANDGTFHRSKAVRFHMACDPTCIALFDVGGTPYIFASTFDSKLFFFRIDASGVHSAVLKEYTINGQAIESPMLCESAVMLTLRGRQVLVCTTRNGLLLHTELVFPIDETCILNWKCIQMGMTSVRAIRCQTDASAAFVSCGLNFCRIRCSADGDSDLDVDSIWFTGDQNSNYSQMPVTGVAQVPFQAEDSARRDLGGFLFAASGDHLLFSKLDSDVKQPRHDIISTFSNDSSAVPRKLSTTTRPTKMLHLDSIQKAVVSTIEAREARQPPAGYRVLHSALHLLDVGDQKPSSDMDANPQNEIMAAPRTVLIARYDLKHAERVYTMVEWPFVDHQGKKYSLLIVGTGFQTSQGKEAGRRLIFNTGKTGTRIQLQKESVYEHPVYCIAMWSNESTISVTGKTLSLDCFDSEAGRWFKRGSTTLPSVGLHISANPPFLYVSTLQHSHICYEIVGAAVEGKFDFTRVFTDNRERSCTHHLILDFPKTNGGEKGVNRIVLVADKKSATLTGLYHAPERMYKNASDTVFEACLPRTVIRLHRGDIRPPWRLPVQSIKISHVDITGVLTNDIIGACSDGTLYSFSILSAPTLHLLRFVQNLIQAKIARDPAFQDTLVSPPNHEVVDVLMSGVEMVEESDKIAVRTVDPRQHAHGLAAPQNKHVDGDTIMRWKNGGGQLEDLVCEGTEKDVEALFVTLAREVDKSWACNTTTETEMQELMVCVKRWMKQVLMPVL